MYFFNELKKASQEIKMFRLSKVDINGGREQQTQISEMNKAEILNTYQAYWQVLKDAKKGKINKVIIPNVMRNILEHFLGFNGKKLPDFLNKKQDGRYKVFLRYINRESHSDMESLTDEREFDVESFMEIFEEIFKEEYSEHYETMMSEADEKQNITNAIAHKNKSRAYAPQS